VEADGASALTTIEFVERGKNFRERCLDIADALLHRDGGGGSEGFAGARESEACQREDTIAEFVTASRVDVHGVGRIPVVLREPPNRLW
jgi:hypothetical protein